MEQREEWIRAWLEDKLGYYAIAKKYKADYSCVKTAIKRRLKGESLVKKKQGGNYSVNFKKQVAEFRVNNPRLTCREIAKKFKIHIRTVGKWTNEYARTSGPGPIPKKPKVELPKRTAEQTEANKLALIQVTMNGANSNEYLKGESYGE